jgi:hypothetical protein
MDKKIKKGKAREIMPQGGYLPLKLQEIFSEQFEGDLP